MYVNLSQPYLNIKFISVFIVNLYLNLTSEIYQGPALTNGNIHLIHEMHFIDRNAELLTIQIQADF